MAGLQAGPRSSVFPPLDLWACSNSIIFSLQTLDGASNGCAALTPYQTGPHSLSSQHCMAEVERPVSVCENGKVRPQFCLSVCGGDLSTSEAQSPCQPRRCAQCGSSSHRQHIFPGLQLEVLVSLRILDFSPLMCCVEVSHILVVFRAKWQDEKRKNKQNFPQIVEHRSSPETRFFLAF